MQGEQRTRDTQKKQGGKGMAIHNGKMQAKCEKVSEVCSAGHHEDGGFALTTPEERFRYIDDMSENVAMRTGIRIPIVKRIIRSEIDLMDEWADDEEQMNKSTFVLARHICARTGIHLTTVMAVMDTEDELAELLGRGHCDSDECTGYGECNADGECADCRSCEEPDSYGDRGSCIRTDGCISMSEMVEILHKKTGFCPKIIDMIIQMEDEVFEGRGISSAYCCGDDE